MALPPRHPDPIVRDLQAIRRLRWSRPEHFGRLETLLTHPLIGHFAFQPKKERQRVKALEAALREVVERIREKEASNPPLGRSVAEAANALLRLSPEFELMSLEDIRSHIAEAWEGRGGGGSLSPHGFRLHLEVPEVYEPVAAEFRLFAEEQSEDYLTEEAEPLDDEPVEADEGFIKGGIEGGIEATMSVEEALQAMEAGRYREHRKAIAKGRLWIRSEDEMLKVLLTLTGVAKRKYLAVDYVDISEWFASPRLNRYLMTQLGRLQGKLNLLRIRVVREEELQFESRSHEQLEEFIKLHDTAGADLLLCHEEAVKELKEKFKLRFAPHVGLFMIDPETESAGVTGKLSGDGAIGQARVYLGDHPELREYRREFELLRRIAIEQDPVVRAKLEGLH